MAQGDMLVRRFTDSLNEETPLEQATVAVQRHDDQIEQEEHEMRMKALYEDRSTDSQDFYAANIAREALDLTCRKFAEATKPSKLAKLGLQRKSTRVTANELLQAQNFEQLQEKIIGLESRWQATHGPVYRNFQRICNTLDSHKKVFAIFPQQNTYCAVLCGSLSLFVSAAVNHDVVAETISKTVADISAKAARAAKLIQVVTTQSMRELLAELYGYVFHFYRDAMEWYLSSKTSKFFGSFNEKLKEKFEKASKEIQNCMDEMYREGNIATLALLSMVNVTATDTRNELVRQRQQSYDDADLNAAGRLMREMLKAIHQHAALNKHNESLNASSVAQMIQIQARPRTPGHISRIEAQAYVPKLEKFIIGTEGQSLFDNGKFWMPDTDVSSRLQRWLESDQGTSTLWITSPDVVPRTSSAQAAAMLAVATAWQSETPIISHFCRRPRSFEIPKGQKVEQAGLLGLLYSLIVQLLQFHVDNEEFEISETDLDKLDGSKESFHTALRSFSDLLHGTPQLSICVIHGVNDLAWSDGADWCRTLLTTLLEHQTASPRPFRILLTTTGQSRVLPEHIKVENRLFTTGTAQEVVRKLNPMERISDAKIE
ncbi:hypothetical protein BDV96DRAFT_500031 [Lophiotrema nucula]|uniref:DUF7708 domain-containing protein n=1 Tax=Lophiotrema nucula TaxID=690887 RepID=A0A6A5YVU7_9PLEO|nr:hypothetical protein BDV96DRAFT_500031 [Lophiotrema nucula]